MLFQYHKYRTAGIKIIFWKKRIIEIYDLNDKLITGVSNQDRLMSLWMIMNLNIQKLL